MSTRTASLMIAIVGVGLTACVEAKSVDDRADAGANAVVDAGFDDAGFGSVDATPPTPAVSFTVTGGGGATRSGRYGARISVGAPAPVGTTQGQRFRAVVGIGVLAPTEEQR